MIMLALLMALMMVLFAGFELAPEALLELRDELVRGNRRCT